MNKLNPKVTALTLGSVSSIVYIACVSLFAIAPRAGMSLANTMMHGIDLTSIMRVTMAPLGTILTGLVEIAILGYLVGWLFAVMYNYFAKQK